MSSFVKEIMLNGFEFVDMILLFLIVNVLCCISVLYKMKETVSLGNKFEIWNVNVLLVYVIEISL